jgi:hypothetical protein
MSDMSEVWKDINGTGVSNESQHQTMAIQRLGHGHDQQNQPSVQQGSPVHFGHHGLFHEMGGGHPYEVSNIEGCYQFLSKSMLFIGLVFLRPSRLMEDRSSYPRSLGSLSLAWESS